LISLKCIPFEARFNTFPTTPKGKWTPKVGESEKRRCQLSVIVGAPYATAAIILTLGAEEIGEA
jgi:hypothetical protein